MLFKTALLSAMAALASAYTQPDYNQSPTGNAITNPGLNDLVTAGKPYTIEWKPSTEGPISLVLLRGPSSNCQPIDTLAEAIDNSGHFDWTPSTDLEPDTTHYGLMLVVEGSGQYQYSTQFGVKNDNQHAAARVASSSSAAAAPAAPAPATTETSKAAPAPTQTSVKDARFETIYSTQEYTTTDCPKCSAEASAAAATSSSATTTPAAPSTTLSSVPVTAVTSPAVTPSGAVPSDAAAASGSASASSSAPPSLFTGAADRNTVGLGAIAAGVLAVLAV